MNDRAVEILQAYWDNQRGENKYPSRDDVSEHGLENIWDDCFIAEVENGKFVYSYFGNSLADAYAENLESTQIVEDMLYPESPELTPKLIEVLNAPEPLKYDGAFINRENDDIKFRKILLPLGENGKVTHIFGAMIWEKF